jgi:hypothetical protein
MIAHTSKPSPVVEGTKITVNLPIYEDHYDDVIANCEDAFLELAESYAWLNPHLTRRISWNGERKLDIKADPTWTKWLPSWPTSAHWYDASRFRAGLGHDLLLFRRSSQAALFGLQKANTRNITKLLAALNALASAVRKPHLAGESAVARDEVAAAPEGAIRTGASVSRHSTRRSYFGFPPRELGAEGDEGGAP